MAKRGGLRSINLPTLRFRGKIVLGFAVVLAISAASMGTAYLGFEHVAEGVAAYRKSVTEADLARNIDRELISYRALVRYYVATGKEEDSKAAQAAEEGLKDAIDQSMRGTTNPARLDQVTKLAREFRAFTKIFADILKTKEESEYLTKNALTRSEMSLEYKSTIWRAAQRKPTCRRSPSRPRPSPPSSSPSRSLPITSWSAAMPRRRPARPAA